MLGFFRHVVAGQTVDDAQIVDFFARSVVFVGCAQAAFVRVEEKVPFVIGGDHLVGHSSHRLSNWYRSFVLD